MAIHSSLLAWQIPRTEEPGGLQSIGSQRVRLDLATKHSLWPFQCPESPPVFLNPAGVTPEKPHQSGELGLATPASTALDASQAVKPKGSQET